MLSLNSERSSEVGLMVKIYVKIILSEKINPATGEPWKIDDVPERWREEVRKEIEGE